MLKLHQLWPYEQKSKGILTALCHEEPEVFGALIPILKQHHLLLVGVCAFLLSVHPLRPKFTKGN